MSTDPITVLIVDDSRFVRAFLRKVLESDPDIAVVGEAAHGLEAVERAAELTPRVILMDVEMPRMDGLEATERILVEHRIPIVIMSAIADELNKEKIFDALAAGAVDFIHKPEHQFGEDLGSVGKVLAHKVKTSARVEVFQYGSPNGIAARSGGPQDKIVVIGGSLGGPAALAHLLCCLGAGFSAPMVVAQQITEGFADALITWLDRRCPARVVAARDGETPEPASVYLPPDYKHICLAPQGTLEVPSHLLGATSRPSIDSLFTSAAKALRSDAIAVLLSGEGDDGIRGSKAIAIKGGEVIVQEPGTCVVGDTPRKALEQGIADSGLSIEQIAQKLWEG